MVAYIGASQDTAAPDPGREQRSTPAYDPTPAEWLWYFDWAAKHRPVATVAADHHVEFHRILVAIRRVDAWKRQEKLFDVDNFRVRQTETLENAALESIALWDEKHDIRYLAEARRLLGDIRKLWGIGKPLAAAKADSRTEGLARVAGVDRITALRTQASQLIEIAEKLAQSDVADEPGY